MAKSSVQSFKGGSVSPGPGLNEGSIHPLTVDRTLADGAPSQEEYDPLQENQNFEFGRLRVKKNGVPVGSYDPFDASPTVDIPAPDYNQDDPNAVDYIKNRPSGGTVYFDGSDLNYSGGIGVYTPDNNRVCVCEDWDGGWNFATFAINAPEHAANVTVVLSKFHSTSEMQLLVRQDGNELLDTTLHDGNTYVIFVRGNQASVIDWATASLEQRALALEGAVDDIEQLIPPSATTANKLATSDDIAAATAGWQSGYTPKGESTVAALNALNTQVNGDQYIVTDSGTLTDGSLAVTAGDVVAWDSTNSVWYKVNLYAFEKYGTNQVHNLPQTASEADLTSGNYVLMDTPTGPQKLPGNAIAKASEVSSLNTISSGQVVSSMVASLLSGSLFDMLEDVTSNINLAQQANKFINASGQIVNTSDGRNVSEAISLENGFIYVVAIFGAALNVPAIAYYSNNDGTGYIEGLNGRGTTTAANKDFYYVIQRNPYKSFRIVSKTGACSVYKIKYTPQALADVIDSKIKALQNLYSVVVDEDLTTQYPITNVHYRIGDNGQLYSSTDGGCTDVLPIDRSKKLCITCAMNQYRTGIAFYKDLHGNVLDSIYPLPNSSATFTNLVVDFPATARSFRLGTTSDSVYSVRSFHYENVSSTVSQLVEDVDSLKDSVAELEESSFLSTVIDTVNAVKSKPTSTIYLGEDIFDMADLSYTPGVWSVDSVNGTVSYLGGSISPLILQVPTDADASYALECVMSNYVTLTEDFNFSIGDGPLTDSYNGTANIFVGARSDGGYIKITPIKTTNTFTLGNLSVRKKVAQGDAVVTKNYLNYNVNCGNSDQSMLDAKWNVAIGPAASTMPVAVSATRCIAIGYMAENKLISGWQNIAIGTFALDLLRHGDHNIAVGCDCLYQIVNASDVVAVGKTCVYGEAGSVSLLDPSTWQTIAKWVAMGKGASKVKNGQVVSDSVYIGDTCGSDGVGSRNVCLGSFIRQTFNKNNVICIGYKSKPDKSNQTVIGNDDVTETKVYGDLVVRGTDNVLRKIVFNNDNTVTWEAVT